MTYVPRSYLPPSLHRRTYDPAPRYGSSYKRVYGHVEVAAPTVELAPAVASSASVPAAQPAKRLAAAA